ncbi:MAG: beta-N-acetylhexosaminidase [Clostridia bacterium]|nr:beta-N-acetylhexosaminidase [Clostridia bacterium]
MLNLIPKPKFQEERFGEFVINSETTLYADDNLTYARDVLNTFIEGACGYKLPVVVSKQASIVFLYDRHVHKEGYTMEVNIDSIVIKASSSVGAFYAVQSIRQLTGGDLIENPDFLTLHALYIEDEPRYEVRSIMLDEARYFHGADVVKNLLDMMAYYKLNTLHWHLTDNEGWRIEIKKYPKLTQVGGIRKGSQTMAWGNKFVDWTLHEGYYTQQEIKEIVQYAERLNIAIIPEIDMPAHMGAALASYPWLSCSGKEIEVPIVHGGSPDKNGIGHMIACPGKEETTFRFIYDVLDEICQLFPAPYVHIGGDEAPKSEWKKCPDCQKLIKEKGLKDEENLQGYFNNKIAVYLKRKGKRMIGWNEILSAKKLDNSIIAQYWTFKRDMKVENYLLSGHDVILSKHQAFYFDMTYAQNNLKTTYAFEPEKYNLNSKTGGILGLEGCLWTEWVPTEERINYQLYPRMQAFAEVAWSPSEVRNYKDFIVRLKKHLQILDKYGIEYCPLSMVNQGGLKRIKAMSEFQNKNAHAEFNRAMSIRKKKKYRV